ncbi:helix-turn-helix domain-containing protein [Phenylobacterium sp.]|uniref:helix-turn-helix domain-containing protein n=1 Tax=Phenylobacterium sp. TaxID=1871053 RepID=UPI003BAA8BD3
MKDPRDGPDPVDVAVGARVRLKRKDLGISQKDLAESIGVTFQQLQKYEKASNRISVSTLIRIADSLGATVADLIGEQDDGTRSFGDLAAYLGQPGALDLIRAFSRLPQGPQRRALLDVAIAMAEG